MKVGYLGPKGTFSFEVAKDYFKSAELVEFNTILEVITSLKNEEIDKAVVPIENSIQGGVTETIDAIIENDGIFVNKEIKMKINQNLLANKKYKLNEIKEIYSHPQAIAQCRKYIDQNLKNAKIIKVSSTALAAKEITQKDYCACIANISCLEEYGLQLLGKNIHDNDFNTTKFWVLSKKEINKGNKMSLIFSTKHKPGALYQVLGIFNKNQINLTKIESRPAKTKLGEYIFLVDLDINEHINKTIQELNNECNYLKVLGRYEEI